MAKPTAETDKELMQQIKKLKEGMVERIVELVDRGYQIFFIPDTENGAEFTMKISKVVKTEEII